MPIPSLPSRRDAVRRVGLVVAAVVTALAAGSALTVEPARATGAYERGPAPTAASISAIAGPFATTSKTVLGRGEFDSATVYHPTSASQGKYGVVAIVPGYFSLWSEMAWLGPRIASQGFVVIGVDTNALWDLPGDRARELAAAIAAVRSDATIARVADFDRVAVSGWSMGGGGALDAAVTDSYRAVIVFAPWKIDNQFSTVTEPTLVLGGQADLIAPDVAMAIPFYTAISGPKAFIELAGADHGFTTKPNTLQAAAMITWLKMFVDGDTRYYSMMCPSPAVGAGGISDFRSTVCD